MAARVLTSLVAPVLALLALLPGASAQVLDDTWFKVTLDFKGWAVQPDGTLDKIKGKTVFYAHIELDDGDAADGIPPTPYVSTVFCETAPGVWQPTSTVSLLTLGQDEKLMVGPVIAPESDGIRWQIVVADDDVLTAQLTFVAQLDVSLDKQDNLKKATFKSLGAVVPHGESSEEILAGGAKIKGKLVSAEQLPFELD